jgi:hypothetical protein
MARAPKLRLGYTGIEFTADTDRQLRVRKHADMATYLAHGSQSLLREEVFTLIDRKEHGELIANDKRDTQA